MDNIRYIPIDQLHINPKAQRPFSYPQARARARDFSESKLGVIEVTPDPTGGYLIADGQHRVGAARILKRTEDFLAHVQGEMSDAEQADLFLGLNDAKLVAATHKFHVRITRGDELPRLVERELAAYGWKVGANKGPGWVTCIDTLERLAAYSVEDLNRTIRIITKAWGLERKGMRMQTVNGISAMLRSHPALEEARLIGALQEITPVQLTARAAAMQEAGVETKTAMSQVLIATYNKGLRAGNRLEVAA